MTNREPKQSNSVGEWYGVRLFPNSHCEPSHVERFRAKQCPFLSSITGINHKCTKNANSQGVCTITTRGKESYSDWMVCPYRALNFSVLRDVVRKLFVSDTNPIVVPIVSLSEEEKVAPLRESGHTFYLFFQDKLGGEISLLGSAETPELSFDVTIVEARFIEGKLEIGKFGILEVQTMDFHGSYKGAVEALKSAVDLHGLDFPNAIVSHPDWLARGIEGPNIANVFKRTFYQTILKFKLAEKSDCVGVVLVIPKSVWQSWRPHLGNVAFPEVPESSRKTWVFILDLDPANRNADDSNLSFSQKIPVSADELISAAFEIVPDRIEHLTLPNVKAQILQRVRKYYKGS